MENKRLKINIKTIILIISIIIFASISVITFAWFTDKESYSGNLTFGTIELDVSGTGIDNTNKTLKFDVSRTNASYASGGKIMPGDTVNIPIKVGLTKESEAAYYIIKISDEKNVFENAIYFSDGTNVYVYDGTIVYLQSDASKTPVTNKFVGTLEKGTTGHDITISAKISTDFEEKNASTTILCDIYAIQMANLEPRQAVNMLQIGFVMSEYGNCSIGETDGIIRNNEKIISTKNFISVNGTTKIELDKTNGYAYRVYCYDNNFNYLGFFRCDTNGNVLNENFTTNYANAAYYTIEISKSSATTLPIPQSVKECKIKIYGNCEVISREVS